MPNYKGAKWNKGGKLARKQFLSLDYSAFDSYIERLRAIEADVDQVVADALENAAEKVQEDTIKAIEKSKLPAKGKYSQGDTENSVIRDIKPTVTRNYVEVKLGFDKTKPGAGGFLITGTPRMQPDRALVNIFGSKKYETDITNEIQKELEKAIKERMS